MSHGGGKGSKIAVILIIVAILGFVIFLAVRISRKEAPPLLPSATSTPTTQTEKPKATSTTSNLINRFFKLLGYDFSTLKSPPRRSGGGAPAPALVSPSTINNPPSQSATYTGPPPEGFTRDDLSPYYGQFRISNVYHPDLTSSTYAFDNSYSEIELSVSVPEGTRVNMTGWRVRSRNNSFVMPKGNEVLAPLAYQNDGYIMVRRGDTVRIFSRSSPNSINFRINKCTGYFPGFIPSLPKTCPYLYPNRAALSDYSGKCQDYVLSLSRCELPSSQPPIPFNDNQCFELLEDANYQGCFDAHRADIDFLGNEWRVYLGTPSSPHKNILDPLHDRVRVFDENEKLVAQYLY